MDAGAPPEGDFIRPAACPQYRPHNLIECVNRSNLATLVSLSQRSKTPRRYLEWNRTRRPRLVSSCSDRRVVYRTFVERGALAAARARSRWVFSDGWPVVRVHFSRGLALHTGHRTDNIRRFESCPVSMLLVFIVATCEDGQSSSFVFSRDQNRNQRENMHLVATHSRNASLRPLNQAASSSVRIRYFHP